MKSLSFCASLILCAQIGSAASQDVDYRNPVLAGDYPDPSVIRVGDEYWATATSSEWGPQFPLLRSTDLVNWDVMGSVFSRPPEWAVANFWAPEIQAWKNRYYVYYVARQRGGPLTVGVAIADRPQGPYTDHGQIISQPAGSIDPVACDDENGQRYLIWKEDGNSRRLPTVIWAARLNEDGTRLVGEPKELMRNDAPWEGAVVEGPFVVRRGEWFYMFYSGSGCCGLGCKYALGVARSRQLLGPWEKHDRNPILADNDGWRCPGHGSIVQDKQGRDWLLYHAYSRAGSVFTGRQMLLDQVQWAADGWPTINRGRGPSTKAPSPFEQPERKAELSYSNDFTQATLEPGWNWPLNQEPDYKVQQGQLILRSTRDADLLGAVLGRAMATADFTATAVIDTASLKPDTYTGIAGVGDIANATGIALTSERIVIWHRAKKEHQVLVTVPFEPAPRVHLRIVAEQGSSYRFAYSTDGTAWKNLGTEAGGKHLPPWDRAVRIALTAGGTKTAEGRFDSLVIAPKDK